MKKESEKNYRGQRTRNTLQKLRSGRALRREMYMEFSI